MGKFYILEKGGSNFVNASENHGFTNQISHALVLEDEAEARAMIKGLKKVVKDGEFVVLAEVE